MDWSSRYTLSEHTPEDISDPLDSQQTDDILTHSPIGLSDITASQAEADRELEALVDRATENARKYVKRKRYVSRSEKHDVNRPYESTETPDSESGFWKVKKA